MSKKINYYYEKLEKMQFLAKNAYYADCFSFQNASQVKINHKLANNSEFLNKVHISPFAGLLNDPNGLAFYKGYYYIFYQNVPQIAMHKTKLWSCYRTKDFINFESLPILIHPSIKQDWDGIFSGGAIVEDGKLIAYYTGNTKKWLNEKDYIRGSATIMCEFDESSLSFKSKDVLFEVDKEIYTGEFRDPFPVKIDNKYYLFHGAQDKETKKGVISIYESKHYFKDFKFLGTLKIKNFATPDAYMYECPIYFKLGNYDVLSFSTQGQKYFGGNEKNDHVLFLIGKMDFENCTFETTKVQHSDLGFDFYACQIFNNEPDDEIIYLGWAAKPQDFEIATFDDGYAHHLNFPRKLEIKNGHIYQTPYFLDVLKTGIKENLSGTFTLKNKAYLINFNKIQSDFSFEISNQNGDTWSIKYENKTLICDRSNMSYLQSVDTGLIYQRNVENISKLEIILDTSFIEIFINDGEQVFSSKYFISGEKMIKTNLKGEIEELKSYNFEKLSDKTILLPGEALIDRYQIDNKVVDKVGGAPLNVCGAIGLLNKNTYFLGAIGNDAEGEMIESFFSSNNLNKNYLQVLPSYKTTIANVALDASGERNFSFLRGADKEFKLDKAQSFDALVLSSATAFLGGNLLDTYHMLTNKAISENKIIFFDPNYRDALYSQNLEDFVSKSKYFIEKSNVIKLSDQELKLIFDLEVDQINKLEYQNKIFLITLGKEGTLVFLNGQTRIISSVEAKVVDTTGAGDSFFGYFIAQFIEHDFDFANLQIKDFEHIIFKANICASFVIQKHGAIESLPSVKDIEMKFNDEYFKKQ